MARQLKGRSLVPGTACGRALVAQTPLSLWGGLDPATGNIPDRRHELCGQCMTGRVFVLPYGKGSSTARAILAESIRNDVLTEEQRAKMPAMRGRRGGQ